MYSYIKTNLHLVTYISYRSYANSYETKKITSVSPTILCKRDSGRPTVTSYYSLFNKPAVDVIILPIVKYTKDFWPEERFFLLQLNV